MNAVDKRSVVEFAIPFGTLMDNAGAAVAAFCLRQYPSATNITVLCGRGNNGGYEAVATVISSSAEDSDVRC